MQYNYNVKPIDFTAYFKGKQMYDQNQMAKQKQAQEDELFQLKKQQLEQSLKPETPEFDMDSIANDLSRWTQLFNTNPDMALSVAPNLAQKHRYLANDIQEIVEGYQSDPKGTIASLEALQSEMNSGQEMKVGRYKTVKIDNRIVMIDTATGTEVKGWDLPAKMSATMEKQLMLASDSAFDAEQTLYRLNDLADQMERVDIGGGIQSSVSEWMKKVTGNQDIVSEIRMQAWGLRNSQVVKSLPPGVASDKDIDMALRGFPPDNAPASQWLSFLRGQAKLAAMDSAYNTFKADWISDRKELSGMRKAWQEQLKNEDYLANLFDRSSSLEGGKYQGWKIN